MNDSDHSFDRSLAAIHTYLGNSAAIQTSGEPILTSATSTLPLLVLNVVLFPHAKLPL
jgi:hypothetical protein